MSICVADLRWFIQHLWFAYIACMDDQFGGMESDDGFGTQQPVRIGNDANDMGLVHALGFFQVRRPELRASYGTSCTR